MEFGPEIKVDGKRPEWLKDDETIIVTWFAAYGVSSAPGAWSPAAIDAQKSGTHGWHSVYSIKLEAGSRHYADPDESRVTIDADVFERIIDLCASLSRTNYSSEFDHKEAGRLLSVLRGTSFAHTPTPDERAVAPELVERMRGLVKAAAGRFVGSGSDLYEEARAILAALEPVDPVEEAFTTLDVFLAAYGTHPDDELVNRVMGDDLLTWGHLRTILAARGRQLEKEGK